jgi:hypothetical protein
LNISFNVGFAISVLVTTSNRVSRLFWFGAANGGIHPDLSGLKEAKVVQQLWAFTSIPIAIGMEVKAMNLLTLTPYRKGIAN